MRKGKIILIGIFLISILFEIKAENPCGTMYPSRDTLSWGIGFIRLPNNLVLKGYTANTNDDCYIGKGVLRFNNDSFPKIALEDYLYLGGISSILLKVYEIKDTKYRICANTIDEPVWIDFEEFDKHGLRFYTYMSVLKNRRNNIETKFESTIQRANIGVNLLHSCLYLRTKPSMDGEVITCLKNNNIDIAGHTHMEVTGITGEWLRVIARDYEYDKENDESGEGCVYKVVREYQGYVKAIDNTGRPNIWYSVTAH